MRVRWIDQTKLTVGESECCLSLCVSPAIGWPPVQVVPRLSPLDSWDRLQQTPLTQSRYRK